MYKNKYLLDAYYVSVTVLSAIHVLFKTLDCMKLVSILFLWPFGTLGHQDL